MTHLTVNSNPLSRSITGAGGRLARLLGALAGSVLAASVLTACEGEAGATKPQASATKSPAGAPQLAGARPTQTAPFDPMVMPVSADMEQRLRIGPVPVGEAVDVLRLPGRFDKNLNRTARVGTPVTGRVTRMHARLGQNVTAGTVLAEISSQDLSTAQLTFLKAVSAEQLQTRAVERAQLLLAADVIGSAELQRRENELAVARAEKRAAFDQLRTVGFSARSVAEIERTGHINSTLPIAATRAGTVVERQIAEGQVVQPADTLFVVSDLSHVWAVADVPEQEADQIRRGQKVQIEVPALDMGLIEAEIVYIADQVNSETRTVRVGVDVENPYRQLRPQMLITMHIEALRNRRMLVPSAAVVREQNADHVFLIEAGRAKLVPVKLGPEQMGRRAVLDGLPAGAQIVLDGAFHLNNERVRRNLEGTATAAAATVAR